jgi:hypothetical protein
MVDIVEPDGLTVFPQPSLSGAVQVDEAANRVWAAEG